MARDVYLAQAALNEPGYARLSPSDKIALQALMARCGADRVVRYRDDQVCWLMHTSMKHWHARRDRYVHEGVVELLDGHVVVAAWLFRDGTPGDGEDTFA